MGRTTHKTPHTQFYICNLTLLCIPSKPLKHSIVNVIHHNKGLAIKCKVKNIIL